VFWRNVWDGEQMRIASVTVLCGTLIVYSGILSSIASAQERMTERTSLETKGYKACVDGPKMLRATDTWERQNNQHALVTINQELMKPEVAAELFISDCSHDLSIISGMAAASDDSSAKLLIMNVYKQNLEFMKWWLQNRRQKVE